MTGKRKRFGYRTFSGVGYRFSRGFDTKLEAKSYAGSLRKQGKLARVTRERDMQDKFYYVVWTRG